MWTADFWKAVAERAVKTFVQTLGATLTVVVSVQGGFTDVAWIAALSAAGLATLLSALTSIGSAVATDGSPSLTNSEILPVLDGEISEYVPEGDAG
jgi:hypothetical protein